MEQSALQPQHAFSHAPAALRIFRFAADTAPRVLEITHVSAFLRECAVEFGSADAALPGVMRNEYARGGYFSLHAVVEYYAARCPWLAEKLLACRSGAPMPAAALAPDVTRHDVNWGAEGARRNAEQLQLACGGFGLVRVGCANLLWAQGAVGVTSGKHFFQVSVTAPGPFSYIMAGWLDDKISVTRQDFPGKPDTHSSGGAFALFGRFLFGTASLDATESSVSAPKHKRQCVVGCLLDLDATPARMTVFVDGEPLEQQCEYDFPKDGRAWFPSVALTQIASALHSCAI
jgi:hypothetical protein